MPNDFWCKTTLWMRVTPLAYKLEQSVLSQKMCFGIVCINFVVRVENLIFSTIFRKKYAKFPIPAM